MITFTTPGGKPASPKSLASSRVEVEVNSDGFTTTVFPAARAAASLKESNRMGEFQGVIIAHTPKGS